MWHPKPRALRFKNESRQAKYFALLFRRLCYFVICFKLLKTSPNLLYILTITSIQMYSLVISSCLHDIGASTVYGTIHLNSRHIIQTFNTQEYKNTIHCQAITNSEDNNNNSNNNNNNVSKKRKQQLSYFDNVKMNQDTVKKAL